jgi:hypothetical protein
MELEISQHWESTKIPRARPAHAAARRLRHARRAERRRVCARAARGGDGGPRRRGLLAAHEEESVLVNTRRGMLVDSHALSERWIWCAGVDVVTGEPQISADHPVKREPRYVV